MNDTVHFVSERVLLGQQTKWSPILIGVFETSIWGKYYKISYQILWPQTDYLIFISPSFLVSKIEVLCTLQDYGKNCLRLRDNECKLLSTVPGTE